MKLLETSIKNFRSIRELNTNLENLSILIGANNSGKSNFIRAIRLIPIATSYLKKENNGSTEIFITEDADTIWFLCDYREPIIICATIDLDESEKTYIEKLPIGLHEIYRIKLEIRLKKIDESKVKLEIGKLSLIGYVTDSSKKADQLLKALKTNYNEDYTEEVVIENGNVLNMKLFSEIASILESKFHYLAPYEGIASPNGINALLIPNPVLPQELKEAFNLYRGPAWKTQEAYKYCKKLTGSEYAPALVKMCYGAVWLKYHHFGGGDQLGDSLIAYIADKGDEHVFIIEEPEIHLHPSYEKNLGNLLDELVKEKNIQIIVATHSPMLIRYIDKVEQKLYLVKKKNGSTNVLRLRDLLPQLPPTEVIRRDLFFSDALMLVEGVSDEIIFEKCIDVMGKNIKRLHDMHVGYLYYADKGIERMLTVAREIANFMDVPLFIITDGDAEGKKYAKIALDMGFKEDEQVFILDVEDILFVVNEDLLCEAFKELLKQEKEKGKLDEDYVNKLLEKLQKKEFKSLKKLFEKTIPKWTIYLARIITKKEVKPDHLKDHIKYILYEINRHICEQGY